MSAPHALSASVGRRIRELRVAAGISLDQLARQAGFRSNVLLAIEAGRVRPSVATLDALARPLRVTVLELVESARDSGAATPARATRGLDAIARAITALPVSLGDKLDAAGAAVVEHAMDVCSGNRSAAARLLGMERKALIRRWQRAQRESKRRGRKSV